MHEMTKKNLETAFAGESQAHMKYQIFAQAAEKEGKDNIARLFRAISFAELVHARNHLKALKGVNATPDNLDVAIGGEHFEVEEMYPEYFQEAEAQGEKEAARSTHYALEAEKIHEAMYRKAKESAGEDKDIDLGKMYICPVCGYTAENEVADFCPVCGAKKEIFKSF